MQPGLVAYYWALPEFMPEIKQNIGNLNKKETIASQLKSMPNINSIEDDKIWEHTKVLDINHTDKMGKYLADKSARARVGMFENIMCFNSQGNGAKIQTEKDTSNVNGPLWEPRWQELTEFLFISLCSKMNLLY